MAWILCCADIAAKLGYRDVSSLTPTAIVIEVPLLLSLSMLHSHLMEHKNSPPKKHKKRARC